MIVPLSIKVEGGGRQMPSLECPLNISPYFSFMPGCKRREGHSVCVRACAKGQHSFPEAQGEDHYEGPGSGEP